MGITKPPFCRVLAQVISLVGWPKLVKILLLGTHPQTAA